MMTISLKSIIDKNISLLRKVAYWLYDPFNKPLQTKVLINKFWESLFSKETNIWEIRFCRACVKFEHLITSDTECARRGENKMVAT